MLGGLSIFVASLRPSGRAWLWQGRSRTDHHHGILVFGLCCDLRSPELGYIGLNETRAVLGLLGLGIERELCETPMAQR